MQESIDYKKKVGVVVDMGGTMIKIGVVRDGVILSNTTVVAGSHSSLRDKLPEVGDKIDLLLAENNYTPTAIGLAFPGIVDATTNTILSKYVKYPDARDLNLDQWALDRWNIPLLIENDARAALLGEWRYGAGNGCDDIVLVTLGTGFGSAVMIGGKLLRGRNHLAGNLGGHITINIKGAVCNCGNIGCLETECSSWAIENYVKSLAEFKNSNFKDATDVSFRTIFQAAASGDKFMSSVLDHFLYVWSVGIINLIHAYDPQKVIIGGGVMRSKDVILPYVQKMVNRHSWLKEGSIEMVAAEQIEFAGLLGIYHLLSGLKKVDTARKVVSRK